MEAGEARDELSSWGTGLGQVLMSMTNPGAAQTSALDMQPWLLIECRCVCCWAQRAWILGTLLFCIWAYLRIYFLWVHWYDCGPLGPGERGGKECKFDTLWDDSKATLSHQLLNICLWHCLFFGLLEADTSCLCVMNLDFCAAVEEETLEQPRVVATCPECRALSTNPECVFWVLCPEPAPGVQPCMLEQGLECLGPLFCKGELKMEKRHC